LSFVACTEMAWFDSALMILLVLQTELFFLFGGSCMFCNTRTNSTGQHPIGEQENVRIA
jgi:hypothetical protein